MMFRNKTAIITGSGRGLGRAVALAFAREGAGIVLCSRTAADIAAVESEVSGAGGRVLPLELDIARPGAIREMVEETVNVFGRIDIVVNNAATIGPASLISETDPEAWARTMEVNLNAPQRLCAASLPHMSPGASVINVTSGMAEIVMPMFGAYSVSKAAVNHMTRIMAEELRGFGIRVNAIDPGVMDTSMQKGIRDLGPEVLGKALHAQFVLFKEENHLVAPEKVAPLALFLASEQAAEISGEIGSAADFQAYGYGLESRS